MDNKKTFVSLFIMGAAGILTAGGALFAQAYIPQLPANTQVTQTITIKNIDNQPAPADEEDFPDDEMSDEEFEKELAKYLEVYEKQEQAKQQEKEPKADPKEEAKKPATSKAKQQTVTQPGKFVPFFQAGGTQSSGSNLLAGPQLAPRPSGYAKPRSRPGRKPGKPRGNSSFKPMNPPPHAKPVMVPGGNAGANPGSDPRLYMPPTGMKPPPPPAKTPEPAARPRGNKPAK